MSKVLKKLGDALPDERPLLSLQIVENLTKCPAGYRIVSRTYDEDADAGLLRQNGLFGKKPSHYICLSKSDGVPGYVIDGVTVVGEREPAPAGFSVAGRAGKRRLCTRVSRQAAPPAALTAAARAPVTDVIVCSRMRQAPHGFLLAGEMNGKMVCYKVSGVDASPTHNDYENVVSHLTPEANRRLRPAPERPPKLSPLISELGRLELKPRAARPAPAAALEEHNYEVLSRAVANARAGQGAPGGQAGLGGQGGQAVQNGQGGQGADGVPLVLHPRLRGAPPDTLSQFPVVKRRTRFELDREYAYSFSVERQT